MFEEARNSFSDAECLSNSKDQSQSNSNRRDSLISEYSVKVINHKKVAAFLETYIVYTIETSDNTRTYNVDRRYGDFQWLYQRLIERYPMCIVPPIPTKHSITTIERFKGVFIEQRQEALDRFIQRVASHHILGVDKELWSFLTMLPTMFQELRRANPVLGKVESLLHSIQNISVGSNNVEHSIRDSSELRRIGDDSNKLADVMNSLGRVIRRSGNVWDQISNVAKQGPITGWAPLMSLSEQCGRSANLTRQQLEPWVVESALYWTQVEQAVRRRNEAESRFLTSLARQNSGSGAAQDESMKSNHLHDEMCRNNADLTSELDQFRSQHSGETHDWLVKLADLHIDHYRSVVAIWRQMVADVSEPACDR